jgi:hypothetical protein
MPRVPFPIVGGSYSGVSKDANPQRSINLYPEYDKTGGRNILRGTPGLVEYKDMKTESLADEQITNGDFADTDTAWTLDETWAVTGEQLVKSAPESVDFEGGESTSTVLGSEMITNGAFASDATSWTLGDKWEYDSDGDRLSYVGTTGETDTSPASPECLTNGDFATGSTKWYVNSNRGAAPNLPPSPTTNTKWTFTGGNLVFQDTATTDPWNQMRGTDGEEHVWQKLSDMAVPIRDGVPYQIEITLAAGADLKGGRLEVSLGKMFNEAHKDIKTVYRRVLREECAALQIDIGEWEADQNTSPGKFWTYAPATTPTNNYRFTDPYLSTETGWSWGMVIPQSFMVDGSTSGDVVGTFRETCTPRRSSDMWCYRPDGLMPCDDADSGLRLAFVRGTESGYASFTITGISVKEIAVAAPGAAVVAEAASQAVADMVATPAEGTNYLLEYTVTATSGSVTPYLSGNAGTARSVSETYTESINCGSDGTGLEFVPSSDFVGTIDTVSMKEFPRTVTTYTHLPAPVLGSEMITNGTFTDGSDGWERDFYWKWTPDELYFEVSNDAGLLNGTFDTDTSHWIKLGSTGDAYASVSDGVLMLAAGGYVAGGIVLYQDFTTIPGGVYTVTWTFVDKGSEYGNPVSYPGFAFGFEVAGFEYWYYVAGTHSIVFTATETKYRINICCYNYSYIKFDNIIVTADVEGIQNTLTQKNASLTKDFAPENKYYMSFDISDCTAGMLTVAVGDDKRNKKVFTTNGTREMYLENVAAGSDVVFSASADFDGHLDNVSLCEAITSSSPALARQYNADMVTPVVKDHLYRVDFTVESISDGKVTVTLGGTQYTYPIVSADDYSLDIAAAEDSGLVFTADYTTEVTLDDVSVKEITYPPYQVRGLLPIGTDLYILYGPYLSKLTSAGDFSVLNEDSPMASKSGLVTMAHIKYGAGYQIMICDGSDKVAYLYDTTTSLFTVLTEGEHEFQGGGTVCAIDGYFLSNQVNGDRIYYSETTDGLSWDASDDTRAWIKTSNIQRVFAHSQLVWAFKEDSIELFYNTGEPGDATPTFGRVQGGAFNIGLLADWSVAAIKERLFWLASDKTVQMAVGQSINTVSTPQLSYQIEQMTTASDAVAYCYTEEGHDFYVISFPTADVTYVYDVSTGEWHERQSYDSDRGVDGRHRSNCYAYFRDKHVVGDFSNTKLYELDTAVYTDDGNRIIRRRVTQNVNEQNLMCFFNEFEVRFEGGVGVLSGQGSSPKAILRISKDGGHTWSSPVEATMGSRGGYGVRSVWRRLGSGRDFAAEVSVSDPVKVVAVDGHLTYEQGYA